MDATTVAVDLAKDVFELAMAKRTGRIVERKRLTRSQFERFVGALPAWAVVMERVAARRRSSVAPCDLYVTYRSEKWSGRLDSNQRPPAPKAGALPGCATPRLSCERSRRPRRSALAWAHALRRSYHPGAKPAFNDRMCPSAPEET